MLGSVGCISHQFPRIDWDNTQWTACYWPTERERQKEGDGDRAQEAHNLEYSQYYFIFDLIPSNTRVSISINLLAQETGINWEKASLHESLTNSA